jgi:hypothetical protein
LVGEPSSFKKGLEIFLEKVLIQKIKITLLSVEVKRKFMLQNLENF